MIFLSTPSARRATGDHALGQRKAEISIHALREEGDLRRLRPSVPWGLFLSTPSARRATFCGGFSLWEEFISIHALREEGDRRSIQQRQGCEISIHALREEGDDWPGRSAGRPDNFYPRPPRGGRPKEQVIGDVSFEFLSTPSARRATPYRPSERGSNEFLSTPSARRATAPASSLPSTPSNFYPRPPRGGRPQPERPRSRRRRISIHALREEGDTCSAYPSQTAGRFLSTPSARRATCRSGRCRGPTANFYPRPPRGGRPACTACALKGLDFYPRPPRGGRRLHGRDRQEVHQFLSTPSARRATQWLQHLPACHLYFYPRPPRGGRHPEVYARRVRDRISIHALREEGDG